MWIWIDLVVEEIIAVLLVLWVLALYVELSHGADERFRTIDQVLVYSEAIQGEFIYCVSVLMYNLHLLHYSGLARLSGS